MMKNLISIRHPGFVLEMDHAVFVSGTLVRDLHLFQLNDVNNMNQLMWYFHQCYTLQVDHILSWVLLQQMIYWLGSLPLDLPVKITLSQMLPLESVHFKAGFCVCGMEYAQKAYLPHLVVPGPQLLPLPQQQATPWWHHFNSVVRPCCLCTLCRYSLLPSTSLNDIHYI